MVSIKICLGAGGCENNSYCDIEKFLKNRIQSL